MPNTCSFTKVTVLIAEDDDGHADLIQDFLRESGLHNPIIRFRDGQEALDFMHGKNEAHRIESDRAYLVLLDIRMPRVDGVEVLRQMKSEERLKKIPVIMLTTTDDPREIENCYGLGCNCYVTKPVEFDKFACVLKKLGLFLMIVQIPQNAQT